MNSSIHSAAAARPVASKGDWRFERSTRLQGVEGMNRLRSGHVTVFGLGGVGSYAVEGLARSGVGNLTLVDFDRVCITNMNRQLHALDGTVGQFKAELMGARVQAINPAARVRAVNEFYNKTTSAQLLDPKPDLVLDCIDNVTAKMHLVATCVSLGIPIITVLGSGGKFDATRVRVVPLVNSHTDPLGRALRKFIRRKHPVTDEDLGRVVSVFSDEPAALPKVEHGGIICGVDCVCPNSSNGHHTCKKRHLILGSSVTVTSVFGMIAAGAAIRMLLGQDPNSKEIACGTCGTVVDPTRASRPKVRKQGKGARSSR